jgi:hypothetical protein
MQPRSARRFSPRSGRRPTKTLCTFVAVYVADQYLLGRPAEAKRALDYELAHGLLYTGRNYLGTPAGANFVTVLMRDLRKWGYVHQGR